MTIKSLVNDTATSKEVGEMLAKLSPSMLFMVIAMASYEGHKRGHLGKWVLDMQIQMTLDYMSAGLVGGEEGAKYDH